MSIPILSSNFRFCLKTNKLKTRRHHLHVKKPWLSADKTHGSCLNQSIESTVVGIQVLAWQARLGLNFDDGKGKLCSVFVKFDYGWQDHEADPYTTSMWLDWGDAINRSPYNVLCLASQNSQTNASQRLSSWLHCVNKLLIRSFRETEKIEIIIYIKEPKNQLA